ncbi:hypothetical protein RchiOBHm_Chr6g0310341 [Rosa chinensis]|uniref:Uncharacterized protein n=1 Tax=Rosa chinensis TaxID=74649 RepID=A0A2P6Q145_ROSCH|nr:hypothetical protein RchiOBHm_Chr6g0310341 [Rosa chinensis]
MLKFLELSNEKETQIKWTSDREYRRKILRLLTILALRDSYLMRRRVGKFDKVLTTLQYPRFLIAGENYLC